MRVRQPARPVLGHSSCRAGQRVGRSILSHALFCCSMIPACLSKNHLHRSTQRGLRPGAYPGNPRRSGPGSASRSGALNEGGGRTPCCCHCVSQRRYGRSTKAGGVPPAIRPQHPPTTTAHTTLNEGRGRTPGNPPPLRSAGWSSCGSLNEGRGRTPGNPVGPSECGIRLSLAQRRPGAYPRQSMVSLPPAWRCSGPLNEGRGRTPGNPVRCPSIAPNVDALNEGRGRTPGNPADIAEHYPTAEPAQRRPGAYPRQSQRILLHHLPGITRSTKAGGVPPAIPDSGQDSTGGSWRSTKAGGVPPAILSPSPAQGPSVSALNEGRGRTPGNPCDAFGPALRVSVAQRRPGAYPRQSLAG